MQPVSELYLQIIHSQNYYVQTKLIIGDSTEAIDTQNPSTSGFGENKLMSVKTTKRVFSNNVPEVGCCPCGEIYIDMLMPDVTVPRMAMLIPYIRLVSTGGLGVSEWLRKGVYYIDTRENTHNLDDLDILTIHGYDAMMRAEVEYGEYFTEIECTLSTWKASGNVYVTTVSDSRITTEYSAFLEFYDDESREIATSCGISVSAVKSGKATIQANTAPSSTIACALILRKNNTLSFPAKDLNVVLDIASKMGVEVDEDTIAVDGNGVPLAPNLQPFFTDQYDVQYPATYTMKETLGYIASMYGGNFVMNDMGKLQFIPIWGLPVETSLLIDDLGYRIVFGEDEDAVRILTKEVTRDG